MENILIYCENNHDLCIKMIDMVNDWIKENHLTCITTKIDFNDFTDEEVSNSDKMLILNATDNTNIHEYKYYKIDDLWGKETHQLDIRCFEWEGISANGKLNLEQAYQYITRRLSDCVSIKKKLPIDFLNT